MRQARLLLAVIVFLAAILPAYQAGQASFAYQADPTSQQVQTLVARMSPEEKVGQLFMVTFKGTDVTPGSQISDLVSKQHIGGVILSADNDNFVGPENTAADIYRITSDLQRQVYEGASGTNSRQAQVTPTPGHYIPLLIGVSEDGDGYPTDQIFNGLTPFPSAMAIGATWKPELSREVGTALGSELRSVGINLLLSPSLDVLDTLPGEGEQDLGNHSFGGSPYWVAQLGQAFIEGVHEGSEGHMAVIAKHFPGSGSSDRSPDSEVATVRKSLNQLISVDLQPFFSVTGYAPSQQQSTDGLLVSHIRYGFQGSIRSTTRPFSFDTAAVDQVLKLPGIISWRQNGGILMSDDLGSQALRRFYDSTGQVFDPRQVARNAFLAGNDLLYLNNFVAEGDPDAYTTILRTLTLFAQKYREDRAFAELVDASVERILTLKYRIYPNLQFDLVVPPEDGLAKVGANQQVSFDVARQAVTLINPTLDELQTSLPRPPGPSDRIVFITDQIIGRQCSHCIDQIPLAVDALQNAVVRLYGPQAGGQVFANRLSSYSTLDLQNMLNSNSTDLTPLEQDLRQSGWIVFALQNNDLNRPESQSIRRFLSNRPDLYRNKRVIAFAFGAPYYMDPTDISKLTAYYGLYSKTPAFVDVAARVLFQELTPAGASPVSIPGAGYNLDTVTSPDPGQVIPISLDTPDLPPIEPGTASPAPTPIPVFKVNDNLPLRTGVIYDQNHNQVPDGTKVRFLFTIGGETGSVQQIETTTVAGIARANYRIMSTGLLEVHVVSDPAQTSGIIRLDISASGGVITPIVPTLAPTLTPTPTETITPTVMPTPAPTPLPPSKPGTLDWTMSMILIWGSAAVIVAVTTQRLSLRWGFRWGMTGAAGGLLAYLYFAVGRLADENQYREISTGTILLVTFFGILLGLFGGWLWRRYTDERAKSQPERHPTGPR